MSIAWVISDLHFGHRNITKYRPEFETMDQHDHTLLGNILSTVKKRDSLWILGDCFFQDHTLQYAKALSDAVDNLNFVPGNHDTDTTERQVLLKGMIGMGLFHQVGSMFKKGGFWLTHPPIHPAELRGKINIHGHVHNATVPDDNYINVCAENVFYKPVNMQMLKDEKTRRTVLRDYGR